MAGGKNRPVWGELSVGDHETIRLTLTDDGLQLSRKGAAPESTGADAPCPCNPDEHIDQSGAWHAVNPHAEVIEGASIGRAVVECADGNLSSLGEATEDGRGPLFSSRVGRKGKEFGDHQDLHRIEASPCPTKARA